MIIFRCRLPFPPSVNGLYGGGSGQKRFKTRAYKEWLKSCPRLDPVKIACPVTVEYIFTWPDRRIRDGQNYQKAVLDLLVNEGVLRDDNWNIVTSELWRHEGIKKEDPHVRVVVRRIGGGIPDIPQEENEATLHETTDEDQIY